MVVPFKSDVISWWMSSSQLDLRYTCCTIAAIQRRRRSGWRNPIHRASRSTDLTMILLKTRTKTEMTVALMEEDRENDLEVTQVLPASKEEKIIRTARPALFRMCRIINYLTPSRRWDKIKLSLTPNPSWIHLRHSHRVNSRSEILLATHKQKLKALVLSVRNQRMLPCILPRLMLNRKQFIMGIVNMMR